MNLLVRAGIALFLVLGLVTCATHKSATEAKIDAQSERIAQIQASLKALQDAEKDIGRFQVMNGTPSFSQNIMLVDTATGRVWLECKAGEKDPNAAVETNWCAMRSYGTPSVP